NIDGKECLRIDFDGATDNYGIGRANIYKNGELYTYRISTRFNTWKSGEYFGINEPKSFFDKNFNLQNDEAVYGIEVFDCAGNKSETMFNFKVTAKDGLVSVIYN
ncbi:MAG: hypothetical protein LBR54_04195, partial [Oscillospiraceae bacterium]|nr:hypothetical protein [Oscillospiraceae bacterium]